MTPTPASAMELWKAHVLQCGLCANAKSQSDLCPIGRSFWSTQQEPAEVKTQAIATIDQHTAAQIGHMVASRVVARTSSGAAIAVPMEKTSKAVEIRTSNDVLLRMPERDIEVYAHMRDMISRLIRAAQAISTAIAVTEETKKTIKTQPVMQTANPEEVALVVRQARSHFGIGSDEALYSEFSDLTRRVLHLGDRLGNFMRVDEPTQRIIRAARTLAIDMQGEIERGNLSETLKLDEETRKLVKPMRMLAIDLQGEIERRVGTP